MSLPQIPQITLTALFTSHKDKIFRDLKVGNIGRVLSYDVDAQTAKVQLVSVRSVPSYGKTPILKPTVLNNVPVVQARGSKGGFITPIEVGDDVLIVFLDTSKDNWYIGQIGTPPNTDRQHHLHDAIAIPVVRNLQKAINGLSADATYINYLNSVFKVSAKFSMRNDFQDYFTVFNDILQSNIDTADYLSQTAQQLSTLANTLATATTIPAVVGSPLTMSPTTIANAQAVKAQADTIKTNVDNVKQTLTTGKNNFGQLFESGQ